MNTCRTAEMAEEHERRICDALVATLEDLELPLRNASEHRRQDAVVRHHSILERYSSCAFLRNPLFITIDDWDIQTGGWNLQMPFFFRDADAVRESRCIMSLVHLLPRFEYANGISFLLYRWARRKASLSFESSDDGAYSAKARDSFHVVMRVPKVTVEDGVRRKIVDDPIWAAEAAKSEKMGDYIYMPRQAMTPVAQELWPSEIEGVVSLIPEPSLTVVEELARCFGYSQPSNEDLRQTKWLLEVAALFIMLFPRVLRFMYVPARGFLNADHEECSGGVYFWCDGKTYCDLDLLPVVMACESIRGLRVSVRDWNEKNSSELKNRATRAASAAILSRNMSHHIGSHVMPRATVKDVKARLGALYEGSKTSPEKLDGYPRVSKSIERLKTVLDDFIQKKADFLAEVTTDPNSSSDSKRIGRDILAPLMRNALLMDNIARNEGFGYPMRSLRDLPPMTKDERDEWWKTADKDMRNWWKKDLTDADVSQLSKMQGGTQFRFAEMLVRMRSTLRLSLCVREDGQCRRILGPELPPYDPLYGYEPGGNAEQPDQFGVNAACAHLDPMIAVPGMVGQYALYGIFENIIRNAAKHSPNKNDTAGLHIHLHIEDDGEDYYRLSIWDDRADPANVTKNSRIPGDKKGEQRERRLAEHLQCWAEADLIDPSGAVRREAWGVAEIVICANLLAGRRQFDYQPGVIEIAEGPSPHEGLDALSCKGQGVSHEGCQKKRLIYRIRLLKAKRAAFIGSRFAETWASQLDSWKMEGVYVFDSVDALKTFLGRCESRQAFQFAVFDGGSLEESAFGDGDGKADAAFLSALPFRVFWLAADAIINTPAELRAACLMNNDFADLGQAPSSDKLMERLWQLWIGNNKLLNPHLQEEPVKVTDVVYLDVKEGQAPYKVWKPHVESFNAKQNCPVKVFLARKPSGGIGEEFLKGNSIRAGFLRHRDPTQGSLTSHDMFEVFGKRSADCDMLLGAALPTEKHPFWELPYAMAEAGLVRILILDERMAERAMTPLSQTQTNLSGDLARRLLEEPNWTPCFWHMAQRAKVYIATHLQVGNDDRDMKPLHEQSYSDAERRSESASDGTQPACPVLKIRIERDGLGVAVNGYSRFSRENADEANEKAPTFDIVVIHQGVIDTRRPKNATGECEISEETMHAWITKKHKWLVVESGRGIPPGLQKKPIRFLSFSVLDQAMTPDGIGKLLLTRRLMALPRFVDNGGES